METTYLRNRRTGVRTSLPGVPGKLGIGSLAARGWELDPGRNPDAPDGWRGTWPDMGSPEWRKAHPGKWAIINQNTVLTGEYKPGRGPAWVTTGPDGERDTHDTQQDAMEHVWGVIGCPHEYHLSRCLGCGNRQPDTDDYDQ